MWAVAERRPAAAKLLIDRGADVNAHADVYRDPKGQPKMGGATEDVPEALKICMEHGNDVNAVNDEGYTALHGAAFRGTNVVVKLLVGAGAKIDVKNKDGWSPETLALGRKFINGGFNRHEDTAALLRQLASSSKPGARIEFSHTGSI